jgi:hypothetical protein
MSGTAQTRVWTPTARIRFPLGAKSVINSFLSPVA